MENYSEVLNFWFEEIEPIMWFKKDENFDSSIRERFTDTYEKIINGELEEWREKAESALAIIIVLDQFSRNMFRDKPEAFKYDFKALEVAKKSIEEGFDKKVEKGRNFFYMPLMHSENLEDQEKCIELFREMAKENGEDEEKAASYAVAHRDIIKRFNRFPHRNKILGRETTEEEKEFLKQPNSSF